MEQINLNVKYLTALSDAEAELLNQFKGEWINQDDSLSVNVHILYSTSSELEDNYEIKTISTTDNEMTLTQDFDADFVIHLKLNDLHHLSYQVMNLKAIGSSQPFILEKG